MMASKMLSRLLPVAEGDVSVYDSLRREASSDLEGQRRSTRHIHLPDDDEDPDDMLYAAQADAMPYRDVLTSPQTQPSSNSSPIVTRARAGWADTKRRAEDDDDVPASLMLDEQDVHSAPGHEDLGIIRAAERPSGSQRRPVRAATQSYATSPAVRIHSSLPPTQRPIQASAKTQAMWLFTNASGLDAFLHEVYQYYVQHGIWSIILSKVISQLTELFVFSFAILLMTCIDYSKVPSSKSISDVWISQGVAKAGWFINAAVFFFTIYWLFKLANNIRATFRLFKMHDFFQHVLGISDSDIQTVSWVRVVEGLISVQDANIETARPSSTVKKYLGYNNPQQRLNAESIANRLMRQDNYYVAMYNKDIIDFTLPIPLLGPRQFYSKSLEWNIDFCLTNFIFDEQGSIRPFCLDVKNRTANVETLSLRLQFAAVTSVVVAPFTIFRFCIMYFFRYYTEFTRNPARVSARTFTPFAEWKIREFNELDHLFQRRLRQAHPFANEYLKQFPKDKIDQAWRFIAFISGAFAAVLTVATLLDPELFLGFEVTPGRTAVFWLTIMVGIFGVAHGSLPDETEVHDPVLHLKEMLMYTHYMPAHWRSKLHSNEVRAEFSALYQMKIMVFLEEVMSLILTPWILWRNSGKQCEKIIDFFREHTVHVEGIGNQCNFAVFGFKKDPNAEDATALLQQPDGLRDDFYGLKDDKMAASISNFAQYYHHFNNRQQNRKMSSFQAPPMWPRMLNEQITEEDEDQARAAGSSKLASNHARHVAARHHSPTMPRSSRLKASSSINNPTIHESVARHGISESKLMAQDSDLDDYDKAVKRSHDPLDSDTDDGDNAPDGNPGVLGMIYQFSKAQAERGAGVQI